MAVIQYRGFDVTVQTIADRNAIVNKVDHMVVIVKDAIADINAGPGKATYRWDASDSSWILIQKSNESTLEIMTEELTIASGIVTASNYISSNNIWDISVVDGDVAIAFPRLEDISVSLASISGLDEYNGYKLRFTYAYGSISTQLGDAMDALNARIDNLLSNDTEGIDSIAEAVAKLDGLGAEFSDFEDAYNAANA